MEKKSVKKVLVLIIVFIFGFLAAAIICMLWKQADCNKADLKNAAPSHYIHRIEDIKRDGVPEPKLEGKSGLRIYYDGVHGARHLYDRDNRRYRTDYHTISGWYRLLEALRTAGYAVHTEDYACFDAESLAPYNVFMIGEQTYHARFMTDDERRDLVEWVKNGGGLFLTVEHTNAHYMSDVFNLLVQDMPIKARFDSICDPASSHQQSPDWMTFSTFKPHPVTEGVKLFSFDNGCSLDTEFGIMFSSDQSWSDKYDPKAQPVVHNGNKRKDEGELEGPLTGVAAFEYGKGRVVVIGDHNSLTNTSLYRNDHHRFAMNAVRWLAHAENKPELIDWKYPNGYDFLIHTGAGSQFELHKKNRVLGYRTAYGFMGKEPQLRPWTSNTMRVGDNALFLGAPTKSYSEEELAMIKQALEKGEPVVWLATVQSIESEAGQQLQSLLDFSISLYEDSNLQHPQPYEVIGSAEWTRKIFRVFVNKGTPNIKVEGLDPIVQLSRGTKHVQDKQWEDRAVLIDLISSKNIGASKFYVIAPFDLFDDRGLSDLYAEGADVIRQQMAELMLMTAKLVVGDKTIYAD